MGNVILLAFSKEHSAAAQSIGKKEVRVETRPVSWLTEGSRLEDVMKSKQVCYTLEVLEDSVFQGMGMT